MRNVTRRKSSARISQRGMRCLSCPSACGEAPDAGVVSGAGLAGNGGDIKSGCWGIRSIVRLRPLYILPGARGRIETVSQPEGVRSRRIRIQKRVRPAVAGSRTWLSFVYETGLVVDRDAMR